MLTTQGRPTRAVLTGLFWDPFDVAHAITAAGEDAIGLDQKPDGAGSLIGPLQLLLPQQTVKGDLKALRKFVQVHHRNQL